MNRPIRVLHIFTILNRGGAESMIMNYYRNIDRSKVQFDFLVHKEQKGVFEEEIRDLGGCIYRLPSINPLFPKTYYRNLKKFLLEHEYKIVHCHINTLSYYPLKVAKDMGIPIRIAHAHTTTQPLKLSAIFKSPFESLKILYKEKNKYKVKIPASHLFACGKSAGEWLFAQSDYKIISNAIDVSQYVYDIKKAERLKASFGFKNELVVGHVGNFSYPKNYPFLLQCFKSIKQMRSDAKLLLIGGGKMEQTIKSQVEEMGLTDDVLFLGVRNDVPDLMQMMDVFLFPSFYEGLPVTLIEAQASGLKIFASDSIAKEVGITEEIYFLPLSTSPDEWAKQIISVDIGARRDNSALLRDQGYDVKTNAQELQKFYLDTIKRYEEPNI